MDWDIAKVLREVLDGVGVSSMLITLSLPTFVLTFWTCRSHLPPNNGTSLLG